MSRRTVLVHTSSFSAIVGAVSHPLAHESNCRICHALLATGLFVVFMYCQEGEHVGFGD